MLRTELLNCISKNLRGICAAFTISMVEEYKSPAIAAAITDTKRVTRYLVF